MDNKWQRYAPPGTIWVCGACGKIAQDRYGIERENSFGWDESCMLNSVLCKYPKGLQWEAVQIEDVLANAAVVGKENEPKL